MEQFRKKLKIRIYLLLALSLVVVALGVYDVFFASETLKNMNVFGFQMGATSAIGFLSLLNVFKYSIVLKDDSKFKLEYNKENDERTKLIKSKAGIPILPVLSVLMIIAGIIAGYYSEIVFYTLVIAAMCQVLTCGFIKIIYMKRM